MPQPSPSPTFQPTPVPTLIPTPLPSKRPTPKTGFPTQLPTPSPTFTCMGPGLVGGPGTCVCGPGLFGTPIFVGTDWTNPCLTTAVKIDTSFTLTGTTVELMSTPEKKGEFAEGVEDAIRQQNGLEAK